MKGLNLKNFVSWRGIFSAYHTRIRCLSMNTQKWFSTPVVVPLYAPWRCLRSTRCAISSGEVWIVYYNFMIYIFTMLLLVHFNPSSVKILSDNPWGPKGLFQFEIIRNILVSSFWFIWIPMSWVAVINVFTLTVRGSTLDVRIWRLQTSDSDV